MKQTINRLNNISESMGTHDLMMIPEPEVKMPDVNGDQGAGGGGKTPPCTITTEAEKKDGTV
jgi:hypothetical protein